MYRPREHLPDFDHAGLLKRDALQWCGRLVAKDTSVVRADAFDLFERNLSSTAG
jgi:hypothetical protein